MLESISKNNSIFKYNFQIKAIDETRYIIQYFQENNIANYLVSIRKGGRVGTAGRSDFYRTRQLYGRHRGLQQTNLQDMFAKCDQMGLRKQMLRHRRENRNRFDFH